MTFPRSSGWEVGGDGKLHRMAHLLGRQDLALSGPVPAHRPNRSLVIKGCQGGHLQSEDPLCWSEMIL